MGASASRPVTSGGILDYDERRSDSVQSLLECPAGMVGVRFGKRCLLSVHGRKPTIVRSGDVSFVERHWRKKNLRVSHEVVDGKSGFPKWRRFGVPEWDANPRVPRLSRPVMVKE